MIYDKKYTKSTDTNENIDVMIFTKYGKYDIMLRTSRNSLAAHLDKGETMTYEADRQLVRQLNAATDELRSTALARAAELEAEAQRLREESNELDAIARDLERNIHLGIAHEEHDTSSFTQPKPGLDLELTTELAAAAQQIRKQAQTRMADLRAQSHEKWQTASEKTDMARQLREIAELNKPEPKPYVPRRPREDSMDPDADFSDPGQRDLWET